MHVKVIFFINMPLFKQMLVQRRNDGNNVPINKLVDVVMDIVIVCADEILCRT